MKNALGSVQTVLVLGGDSDIANATLKRLVAVRTHTVILAGRDTAKLQARAEALQQSNDVAISVEHFDAVDYASHPDFVERVFSRDEDIDLVLVAFGLLGDQERDERDPASAVRVAQVNYVGAMSVMLSIAAKMKQQGHGTIVVLSTVAAERARRSNFIYGSSKAGIDWFSQGLGDALQGTGVHVMIVRPGFARSKMTAHMKTPPMATAPDTVADAIVNGLRRNREIIWVPGRLRWVMSVLRHLPRPIFRRLNV